jgi:hypothetical protein
MAGGWLDGAGLSEDQWVQLEEEMAKGFLGLVGHKEIMAMRPLLEDEETAGGQST